MLEPGTESILAFDVGGSHIGAGLFSLATGTLTAHRNALLSNDSSCEQILGVFRELASMLHAGQDVSGIAVAVPNPFNLEQGISYMEHKYKNLHGVDLRSALAHSLHCRPDAIHFLNDAAAFLIGEVHQGMAMGLGRVVGITLGTGVGAAFAVDGEIVDDGPGVPSRGEIWNLPYGDGTVEDAVSMRAIQSLYEARTGIRAEVREIARKSSGDTKARESFEVFGSELGKAVRVTCGPFLPDRIVLGGGVSRSASLFLTSARAQLEGTQISLCVSELMDLAPLIGASVSWLETHASQQLFPQSLKVSERDLKL